MLKVQSPVKNKFSEPTAVILHRIHVLIKNGVSNQYAIYQIHRCHNQPPWVRV